MLASLLVAVLATQAPGPVPQQAQPPPVIEAVAQKPWPPAGVARPGPGIVSPRLVRDVKPNYTAEAMHAGVQGQVFMEAVVRADGTVGDVRVARSLDPGLDAEAVRALRLWRFEPGRRDGTAVPVVVDVQMSFSLRDRGDGRQPPAPSPVIVTDPSTAWPPAGVARPGPGIVSPRLVRDVKPHYTPAAMGAGIQGLVWLEVVVEPDGTVGDVRVTRSLDAEHGLDDEAVRSVRQWQFQPGTQGGVPLPVVVEVQMSFALKK